MLFLWRRNPGSRPPRPVLTYRPEDDGGAGHQLQLQQGLVQVFSREFSPRKHGC